MRICPPACETASPHSPRRVSGRATGRAHDRRRLRQALMALAAVVVVAAGAHAEHTRWWRQNSFEDLDKGTASGVALRSDGKLFLAPRFSQFADANLAYLLALRADSKGNLFAAGGSSATVLRLDPSGKAVPVFESTELAVQALAVDSNDNLYAATSPDGKVYKITPAGQSSVFFDPKSKYIWDLVFDRDGTLYVATGDSGQIFAVEPGGRGRLFYSGDESHIRALAVDTAGNLLAGTEPRGLVLRISRADSRPPQRETRGATRPVPDAAGSNAGRAFVLYETERKEVTALALDPAGNLYVAAVGDKAPAAPRTPGGPGQPPASGGGFTITLGPSIGAPPGGLAQSTPLNPFPPLSSSSVYRIAPDGTPSELWESREDVVYSLGLLPSGKLLLGTGNQGVVLQLEEGRMFSQLARTASGQVTAFAMAPGGKLFLVAANPGKIFSLGPEIEPEGTFESQPYDARNFSRWGRIEWWSPGLTAAGTGGPAPIEFLARSGNTSDPGNNWSPWTGPYTNPDAAVLQCPPARFVQWKAVLRARAGSPPPELDWVSVAYLPKNVPPEVTAIAIQTPGVRAQGITMPAASGAQSSTPLRMPQPTSASNPFSTSPGNAFVSSSGAPRMDVPPQGFAQKGFQSVLWAAEDANEDSLEFAVYFRSETETAWKLLKDKIDARFYSWDTTTMPDGAYYLKIVATDAPGNPAGEELISERLSDRFEVDNTPPVISQLAVQPPARGSSSAAAVQVQFQAADSGSAITRAQYSIDAGEWILVFPADGLSDSMRERYDFRIERLNPGEHTITVRVYDQLENIATSQTTVQTAAGGN